MKKFLTVLLVLVMLMSLVSMASASEAGKLLIWCDETRAPVLGEAGKDFTALYGVPVEVQEVGFGDIRGKLTTAAPVGEGAEVNYMDFLMLQNL
jgi:maltose-binding protein MalE